MFFKTLSCCIGLGKPSLTKAQAAHLYALADAGEHTSAQIGELLGITRSTVYRYLERRRAAAEPLPA